MKTITAGLLIFICLLLTGCTITSNYYIINISEVSVRVVYQLKSADYYGFFGTEVKKYKVIRENEGYDIGNLDSNFSYVDDDLYYEILLNPNEALFTGKASYNNMLKNTQYCDREFSNLISLSIVKIDGRDSTGISSDSIYITGGMMCSVSGELDKSYVFVIR